MALGILDMIGLAASLIFALPLGIYGLNRVLAGDTLLGGALVVIAVLMVYLPQKLTTPADVPSKALERVVGGVAVDPDESGDETKDSSR